MSGSVVQAIWKLSSATGASLAQAFAVNNTAGNCIVVVGFDNNGSGTTLTLSDSRNTYGTPITFNDTGEGNTASMWVLPNIAAGANTVTLTGVTGSRLALLIMEVGGVTKTCFDAASATKVFTPGTATDAVQSLPSAPSNATFMLAWIADVTESGAGTLAIGTGWTATNSANVTVSDWGGTINLNGYIEWQSGQQPGVNHTATFTDATNGGTHNYIVMAVLLDESTSAWDTITGQSVL